VAAVLFIRMPLKRALQNRIMSTTDYMLWTRWGNYTQQYKGETTNYVKTKAAQNVDTTQLERKDKHISSAAESSATEDTVSSGVEEGSQPALKTFDLNSVLH
jgi:hypothetical protein